MRYIQVPAPIDIKNPVTGDDVRQAPFFQFVVELLMDPRFSENATAIDIAYHIHKAVKSEASPMVLESAHWLLLRTVADAPHGGYVPGLGVQMRPFIRAILDAKEEP